jgi:hypothetical protein
MKIYLAARYSRHPEMREYAAYLESLGHIVTARWIIGDHDIRAMGRSEAEEYMPLWAQEDWSDLFAADTLISFTEGPKDVPGRARGGRHVEFGAALAAGIRCIVVGYRENVFHWMPEVEYFSDWEQARAAFVPVTQERAIESAAESQEATDE